MFVSYPVNLFLVRQCPVMSGDVHFAQWEVLRMFKTSTAQNGQRHIRLMYGHCVAYTLHKLIINVRGYEFCHLITKFCMFCLFSLRNISFSPLDQDFSNNIYITLKSPRFHRINLGFLSGGGFITLLAGFSSCFSCFTLASVLGSALTGSSAILWINNMWDML